jgi:hypothetical protein
MSAAVLRGPALQQAQLRMGRVTGRGHHLPSGYHLYMRAKTLVVVTLAIQCLVHRQSEPVVVP